VITDNKQRRLFTELPREVFEPDSELGLLCINIAINSILNGLVASWERLLAKCDEHLSILEDKIYENPADETRAPELWSNSSVWLKIEKLLSMQISSLTRLKSYMQLIALDDREFFENPMEQLKRLGLLVDEELVRPTANLSDMMYKSVDIRDSKHSLDLGTSMWRLSWITFIFLPLTFLTGFFGMNVDVFQPAGGFPHVYWYALQSLE
jgi:Mg2+ and Co2+ transporter CorA